MPVPRAKPIDLSDRQRQDLLRLARAHSTPRALAFRARIGVRAADADRPTNLRIAAELGCDDDTVRSWRKRFAQPRLDGLRDLPRPGRPPVFPPPRPGSTSLSWPPPRTPPTPAARPARGPWTTSP